MPATEAQVRANKANAARSTGPKTPEGKEASRSNSYKHGLTGAGIVLSQREAVEVASRARDFYEELRPSGYVGQALVRLAATMSVRMERCVAHENAMIAERVRQAEADFEPPEGLDAETAAHFRTEAGKRALFDPSHEATLARKYEAAATRTFFRALKELRVVEKPMKVETFGDELGSILPGDMTDEEFDTLYAQQERATPRKPAEPALPVDFSKLKGRIDVPFTIGQRR